MIPSESTKRSELINANVSGKEPVERKVSDKIDSLKLIILSGSSSAGKSSVMSAFCKNQKNTVQLGADDFATEIFLPKLIREKLPNDYQLLKNVFDDRNLLEVCNPDASIKELLMMKPELLKAGSTQDQIERACQLLADRSETSFNKRFMAVFTHGREEHFMAILQQFKDNKTVIFDTPFVKEFFEFLKDKEIIVEEKVQHLLVYLPLNVLLERVERRNAAAESTGNFANFRSLTNVMGCFMRHYKPIVQKGEIKVDVLRRDEITQLFDRFAERIKWENEKHRRPLTLETLLEHFGFTEGITEVAITTDFRIPQGILHSAEQTPSESAYQLRNNKFTRL